MMIVLKVAAVISAIIIISALVLVALKRISWNVFWLVSIVIAAIAYWAIPTLRKKMVGD